MKPRGKNTKGFTLLEILIVLVILAVVAGLAVPAYISAVEKSRKQEALGVLGAVRSSALRYFAQSGSYNSMTYANMDFDPTATATGGATVHFGYAAPVVGGGGTTFTVTATRNGTNFAGATSGCPAGYTVAIANTGTVTSNC